MSVVAIVSIGMTMVIVTGGIDVSVGSMLALCMLMSAKTMVAGGGLIVALLVSLGVGLLMGLINGAIVAYGRIHPIIVTLGTLNIIRAVHIQILGPQWITPPPAAHSWRLARSSDGPSPGGSPFCSLFCSAYFWRAARSAAISTPSAAIRKPRVSPGSTFLE